jgi:hypothetical protein
MGCMSCLYIYVCTRSLRFYRRRVVCGLYMAMIVCCVVYFLGHVQRASVGHLQAGIFAKTSFTRPDDGCVVASREDGQGSCSENQKTGSPRVVPVVSTWRRSRKICSGWISFDWKKQQWRRYLVSQARIVAAGRRLRGPLPPAGPHIAPPKLSRAAYRRHQVLATGPRAVIPSCFLLGRLIEIRSKERERRVKEREGSKTAESRTHGRNISIILHCSPHIDINYVSSFIRVEKSMIQNKINISAQMSDVLTRSYELHCKNLLKLH